MEGSNKEKKERKQRSGRKDGGEAKKTVKEQTNKKFTLS